jgi:ketosteroid isomerase-like protein
MKFATPLSTLLLILVGSTVAFADVAAEVEASNAEFEKAFNSGDAAGVAQRYTEDAVLLPPGTPNVVGRDDIRRCGRASSTPGRRISTEGGVGGCLWRGGGRNRLVQPVRSRGGRKPDADVRKYLVVWRQDGEGAWRMHQDIWNDDPVE